MIGLSTTNVQFYVATSLCVFNLALKQVCKKNESEGEYVFKNDIIEYEYILYGLFLD